MTTTIAETAAQWRVTADLLAATTARSHIEQAAPQRARASSRAVEVRVRMADASHQVVILEGGPGTYRRKPCSDCPWRKDATGIFPPEAFVLSASTAYDMAKSTFACHQSGKVKPAICAGFLLRGAAHNLEVRLGLITGRYKLDVKDGGLELHDCYRDMAITNGVDPNDPALGPCR